MLEDRTWKGAVIVGPAVLAPLDHVTFANSSFDGDPESLFINLEDGRKYIGLIGLKNVTFDDCEFRNIGIAGTADSIEAFRTGLNG